MKIRSELHITDVVIIFVYFLIVLIFGIWSIWKTNRRSLSGYFLAQRSISWPLVGASLFASNIGSEHFIGLAGAGSASGIAVVLYEWMAMILLIILAWIFVPVYITAGVYTLPEYLSKRYGRQRLRIYMSLLSLILYVITKVAVSIYSGALFIQLVVGWNMYASITILLTVTCLYTVLGGLPAVIYTDFMQTFIILFGASFLTIISFMEVGGYEGLKDAYFHSNHTNSSINSTCWDVNPNAFNIIRDPVWSDYPWPGLLIQSSFGCLWYWCCDQVIVQRTLASKTLNHCKGGAIFAGYLKILPLFFIILPGMISRALYPDEVNCSNDEVCQSVCDNAYGCSNIAYPLLVIRLLPIGARGLLIAVMISAIISSLTSIFNSSGTIFTMDIYRYRRPLASDRELLIVGRVFCIIMCAVSILWIPLIKSSQGGQIFIYIQAVQGYLGSPVGAVFLLSILWKDCTEKGAFVGIISGHILGIIRMVLDFVYVAPKCGEIDTRPYFLQRFHYTYFGTFLLLLTSVIIVIISCLTRKHTQVKGLTYWTKFQAIKTTQEQSNHGQECTTFAIEEPQVTVGRHDKPSLCKTWVDSVCGLPNEDTTCTRVDHHNDIECYFRQSTFMKYVLNINAVIGLCVLATFIGVLS